MSNQKPHIRLKGGVWRVTGPQGSPQQEAKAKSFVRQLNRADGKRRNVRPTRYQA